MPLNTAVTYLSIYYLSGLSSKIQDLPTLQIRTIVQFSAGWHSGKKFSIRVCRIDEARRHSEASSDKFVGLTQPSPLYCGYWDSIVELITVPNGTRMGQQPETYNVNHRVSGNPTPQPQHNKLTD